MTQQELAEVLADHLKWVRGEEGGVRADLWGANLGGADLRGANLERANLKRANLGGADLRGANLERANLKRANLGGANLEGANLVHADLGDADLRGANLGGADLRGANLEGANLVHADLGGANLERANLEGAYLERATIVDGRKWEDYSADHLAGICQTPEIRAKAVAAWGAHSWSDCPMHDALGISNYEQAENPSAVACWVALYDANLLSKPVG